MSRFGLFKGGAHGNKKSLFVVLGIIIIIFFFFSLAMVQDSQSPEFCAKCHVIQPYYLTWQNSAHSNTSCVQCHVEPGTGFIAVKLRNLKELYAYMFKDVTLPIEGTREISSEACLQCHSPNRVITPSKDLQIPHSEHLNYGTSCADCHPDVAHAGIRAMNTFKVTDEVLTQFASLGHEEYALTKTGCLECHDGKRVTYNCAACHAETRIPENHDLADFGYRHGPFVHEDIGDCMRCHTGFGKIRDPQGNTIPEITRNARFCLDCHEGERPVTHTAFWSVGHKLPGKADRTGCLVCHDWNKPEPPLRAANIISCASCHEQTPDGHDNPRWYYDHKITVKDAGSFSCFDCHGATSCFNCHTKENVGFTQ